ncbi:integral peroxisomal membrane peroxin-domain-containing protein [Gloeopeniophorella convolvens]|nr:integral peroxisomal membrane peroxin-domain-containing protein [Gloeopeniophorella convolvens]
MHQRTASQPLATPHLSLPPDHVRRQQPEKEEQEEQPNDALAGAPTLIDFLHTVPAPLVALIVRLAPSASFLRHAAQVLSWKASPVDSWLVLAGWWALVLSADHTFRYLLPVVIFSVVAFVRRRPAPTYVSQPISENAVQATLRDFSALVVLLPSTPSLPGSLSVSSLPLPALVRASAIVSIPYIILTYIISVRVLIGLLGTVALTYRAPFARLLRAALWRSAFVRWAAYRAWAGLSGIPMPTPIPAPPATSAAAAQAATATVGPQLRFAFTVYENQRWWMALDWTAALLPGERPSWCSASQAPLPPPAAFALPAPTTALLPVDGAPDIREQRTATWAWADSEWRVAVRRDGEGEGGDTDEETDADGWVYGDNKWEGHSGKGGIGKYTRYRRWTRVAVLTETSERIGPGPTGVLREDGDLHPLDTLAAGEAKERAAEKESEREKRDGSPESGRSRSPNERRRSLGLGAVGDGIRQRLQAAVSGSH